MCPPVAQTKEDPLIRGNGFYRALHTPHLHPIAALNNYPEKNSRAIESHLQTVGWISRRKTSRLPAEGEVFLLTSPLIELPISVCDDFHRYACRHHYETSVR